VRGAIRDFIEATTPYRVCGGANDGPSAVQKAKESLCDVVLLDLRMPGNENIKTASALRNTLPTAKLVGFSMFPGNLEKCQLDVAGLDAVLTDEDGLSQLVATLKAMLPQSD